jgi:membrane protease YdiL (CAAX protease family)
MRLKIFAKYGIRPFEFFVVRKRIKEDIFYGIVMYLKFFLSIVGAIILIFLVASMWDMIFRTRVFQQVGIFITASQLERLGIEERVAGMTGVCLLLIFAPFFEELFFRGCLYRALRARWGQLSAILVSSFIFSLLHGYFFLFLYVFIVGVVLAFMYEKRGSLVAPLAFHMINNLVVILFVATSYNLR